MSKIFEIIDETTNTMMFGPQTRIHSEINFHALRFTNCR